MSDTPSTTPSPYAATESVRQRADREYLEAEDRVSQLSSGLADAEAHFNEARAHRDAVRAEVVPLLRIAREGLADARRVRRALMTRDEKAIEDGAR